MEEAECRHGCGTRLTRRELQVHESEECPTLPVSVLVSKMKGFMKKKLDELEKTHQLKLISLKQRLKEQKDLVASSLEKEEVYKKEIAELKDKFKVREVVLRDLRKQDEQHKLELLEVKHHLQDQGTESEEKVLYMSSSVWPDHF